MKFRFEEIRRQLIDFVRLRRESPDKETREAAELMEQKLQKLTLEEGLKDA